MKRFLRVAIPAVFYALLVVFLWVYVSSLDFTTIRSARMDWGLVLVASVVLLASRFCGAFAWVSILRTLGAVDIRLRGELNFVYAKAWLGRYIPGKAPWILGKIYFASQHGISRNKLAVSSLLEAAIQIVVQLALALALLIADSRLDVLGAQVKVLLVVALLACLASVLPPVFNRLFALAYRLIRKSSFPAEHRASWNTIGRGSAMFTLVALLNGTGLYLIAWSAFPDLPLLALPFIVGAGTLAGVVGMLAVFAPSGLGVRDGILLVLLSLVLPAELALVVTVFSRLWDVVIDLLYLAIAAFGRPRKEAIT